MLEFFQLFVLSAALEFGISDGNVIQYRPYDVSNGIPPAYAELDFGIDYKCFFLDASVRTDMFYKTVTNWEPIQMTYAIGGGIKYDRFTIGVEHSCFHPMMTYSYATMMSGLKQAVPGWEGSYNTLYVRIQIVGE